MSDAVFLYLLAVFLVAGVVKGTVGIGLPTASVGLMTLVVDPRLAISLVVLPILITNSWQVVRSGETLAALRRYGVLCASMVVVLYFTTFFTARLSTDVLILALGIVIALFAALSLIGSPPKLHPRHDTPAQFITGVLAGLMGGMTAIWSPPLVVYLLSIRPDKDEFIRATGLTIFVAGLPLLAGFWQNGLLTPDIAWSSLIMCLPAIAGFTAGEYLRRRLSTERFRKAVLLVFLVMGLNLVRKAIF